MNHTSKAMRSATITPQILICASTAAPASGAGDIRHGSDVFAEECAECHSVREGKHRL
ncbi:MAG: hypothetical protein HGA47_04545 [Zoogloea sp.]|nr:hypothetical protein [Zoogloea sp.]